MTYLGGPLEFYALPRDAQIRALAWDRIVRPAKKAAPKRRLPLDPAEQRTKDAEFLRRLQAARENP